MATEAHNSECIFSVDVEDWFHILDVPSTPRLSQWESLPSHVEKNFRRLLDIFAEHNVHVTCFFLGWIAEKYPHLVKEAVKEGHEIASHGYSHTLVYQMTQKEFYRDALKSKDILEDITGKPVCGYRAAGFSVTEKTPWFFQALIEAGFRYDTSVFPASRSHGGIKHGRYAPYVVRDGCQHLVEIPITIWQLWKMPLCLFGGGYLRFFPYHAIQFATRAVLQEGRPVVFYVHPREIDVDQPRLPMNWQRRLKCYVNMGTTERKIETILQEFRITTFEKFLMSHEMHMRI